MKSINFELPDEYSVIIVDAIIEDKFELKLVLDTAATHTTIDSNILFLAGYELKNSIKQVEVETANGIIISDIFKVNKFETLGKIKYDFSVQVYDFHAHGITSDYDGVVGLDFFRGSAITLDLKHYTISVL